MPILFPGFAKWKEQNTKNTHKGPIKDCYCYCNLFSHGALIETCPCVSDQNGVWKYWFLGRGEHRTARRKTSWDKRENQEKIDVIDDTCRLCTRLRIAGIKAMLSGISGGKQVLKLANTRRRLNSLSECAIRLSTIFTSLLLAVTITCHIGGRPVLVPPLHLAPQDTRKG